EEEASEVNDKDADSKLLNINTTFKPLRSVKDFEELVKIFEPFEIATEAFSAEKYPMLLVVYLIIKVLKSEFGKDLNLTLNEDDFDEEYCSNSSNSKSKEVQKKYWDEPKYATIRVCYKELDNIIIDVLSVQSTASSGITSANHYFASIFDDKDDNLLNDNELDKYLDTDNVLLGTQPLV
ncbi:3874_t:CDS:2, partial [Cetraspora pellucida]